jgi:hypothetical protein
MEGRIFRPFSAGSVTVGVGMDGGLEARCFADEVVVDFPSVAPAIDRMRSAFLLDERGAALRTAVQLTRSEAHEGAIVPVNVSVRCTCLDCGGRGEGWAERCGRCQGSGLELRPQQLRVAVPAGVLDGACFKFTVTPRHNPPTHVELRVLVV